MDPFSIAATAIQIGTILDQNSSKARAEREQQSEIRRKKAELITRSNINKEIRKSAGLEERASIHAGEAGSGFINSDSEYIAKSMETEFYDLENADRELAWESRAMEQEIKQSQRRVEAGNTGSILSSSSSLLSLGAGQYKDNPSFRKSVDNNSKNWWGK